MIESGLTCRLNDIEYLLRVYQEETVTFRNFTSFVVVSVFLSLLVKKKPYYGILDEKNSTVLPAEVFFRRSKLQHFNFPI